MTRSYMRGDTRWRRWNKGCFLNADKVPSVSPMATSDAEVRVLHNHHILPHVREHTHEELVGVTPLDTLTFQDIHGRTGSVIKFLTNEFYKDPSVELDLDVADIPVILRGHVAWKNKETSPPLPIHVAYKSHQESGHIALFLGADGHVSVNKDVSRDVKMMHALHEKATHTATASPPRIRIEGKALPRGSSLLLLIPLKVRCPWNDDEDTPYKRAPAPVLGTVIMVQNTPLENVTCGTRIHACQSLCPLVCSASSARLYKTEGMYNTSSTA